MMENRWRRRMLRLLVLGAAWTAVSSTAWAANADTLHDIDSEIANLRNARDEIRNWHQLEKDIRQTDQDLQTARRNIREAKQGTREAAAALQEARTQVTDLGRELAGDRQALSQASEELRRNRADAQAARAAEAAYAPEYNGLRDQVEARQQAYDALEQQAEALSSAYEAASRELESEEEARQEEAAAAALGAVDYQPNRLFEAEQEADEDGTRFAKEKAEALQARYEGPLSGMEARLADASSELEQLRGELDARQPRMEALTEARTEAEEREAQSRQQVAEYTEAVRSLETQLAEARKNREDAETYDREARAWLAEAQADEGQLTASARKLAYEQEHFGDGKGLETGFEYYHWKGDHPGHQWFVPLSYYGSGRLGGHPVSLGISTGYFHSSTGLSDGGAGGQADTQLSFRYSSAKNDRAVDQVRYLADFNLPTGQHEFFQDAVVPEGLARLTDFGAGFEFTPGVELIHRYNERDSLTGRLQYTFRSPYTYSREIGGRRVAPGDIFRQTLRYQHAGQQEQLAIQLQHSSTGRASQDSIFRDGQGVWQPGDTIHYTEGDEWELRLFYNRSLTDRDELALYTIQDLTGKTRGYDSEDTLSHYYGLGWTHHMDRDQEWHVRLHYKDTSSSYDPLRLDLNSSGYKRYALVAGYARQIKPNAKLKLDLERYTRRNDGANRYQGWAAVLQVDQSL